MRTVSNTATPEDRSLLVAVTRTTGVLLLLELPARSVHEAPTQRVHRALALVGLVHDDGLTQDGRTHAATERERGVVEVICADRATVDGLDCCGAVLHTEKR